MATENAPKTFADLYNALAARLRNDSSNSATTAQSKQYINLGLMNMHLGFGERFPWAERKATLITAAPYSTGTVSVSVGGTTVTGVSTLWNTAGSYGANNVVAGSFMKFGSQANIYEIASIASDTSLTLSTRYVGSAALSAATYSVFQDEYDLAADFLKPIDQQNFDTRGEIELISRTDFRRMYPLNHVTGKILKACIQDRVPSANTTPRRRVRFYKPPSASVLIPYAYVTKYLATSSAGVAAEQLSADADEPIVPYIYRHGIVLHALKDWYRDKKDDERSVEVNADYETFMLRILSDGDVGQPRMRLQPRMGMYTRSARRPWSGGGRRYDLNGAFDRLER